MLVRILSLIVVSLTCGCRLASNIEGVPFALPKEVSIERKASMEDFDIYAFIYRQAEILSAYVGNNPNFPSKQIDLFLTNKNICYTNIVSTGNEYHYLIRIKNHGWPMYVHYMHTNNTPEVANIATKIILSTGETGAAFSKR